MSMIEVIQDVTKWLAWGGSGLGILTVLAYLFNWGIKFIPEAIVSSCLSTTIAIDIFLSASVSLFKYFNASLKLK